MALDPNKQRKIIVVHGVQTGENDGLHQDELIRTLLADRLGDLELDYEVDLYKYENLNNEVLDKYQDLVGLLIANPVGSILAQAAIDVVGDVVISLSKNSTAEKIRQGLTEKILAYYDEGYPCYVVAHSLGTVYSFDVINQLMKNDEYFDPDNQLSWPVLGWVSLGSPLGLDMFKFSGRDILTNLGDGDAVFPWRNYYDPNDPVVSGSIFGAKLGRVKIAEQYLTDSDDQGWWAEDSSVNTGKLHLLAHTAYWQMAAVGDGIRTMVSE